MKLNPTKLKTQIYFYLPVANKLEIKLTFEISKYRYENTQDSFFE